jgi:hypothetical protein
MENETTTRDLKERLDLIESMIAEGRRKTESWGWTFVLWGVAYYVAIAWATWGQGLSIWGDGRHWPAWPVTMIATAVLTMVVGLRKGRGQPGTLIGLAIFSIWTSVGIAMLVLFLTLGFAGRPADPHLFVAVVAAMLGVANGACGLILKWKMQVASAVVWWITSAAACFGSDEQLAAIFLAAIFLCQIVFGIYAMVLESRRRSRLAPQRA